MWRLLHMLFFVVHVRAASEPLGGWDDFTNNLATDLVPFIALFGEQATKQFLSESISYWDNIIFAVAPIGIITAVVSVIRVLGSASQRAFVGRAQEGRGQAEAELCSSTSYDVCELWNNGGIARVFGRPQILEFIFCKEELDEGEKLDVILERRKSLSTEKNDESDNGDKTDKSMLVFYETFSAGKVVSRPTAGIYEAQEYHRKAFQRGANESNENERLLNDDGPGFAPNPNLSLNVGIQKPKWIVLCCTAILGCLLQTSVLGFGGWAVYKKGLKGNDERRTYVYFWLAFSGTILLVAGMFLCAWLIEQSTQEAKLELGNGRHVFWVQPGNQTVGDQTFEAFAYTANLKEYTASWRKEEDIMTDWRKKTLVWLAISTSLIGFILQFTGLRGLHSSVAMYQFAATILMALARSFLRTRRLEQSANLLQQGKTPFQIRDFQNLVEGHELDWQTLRIDNTVSAENHSTPNGPGTNSDHTSLGEGNSTASGTYSNDDAPSNHAWIVIAEPLKLQSTMGEDRKKVLENRFQTVYKTDYATNSHGTVAWMFSTATDTQDQDVSDGNCANALIDWIAIGEAESLASTRAFRPPNAAKRVLCYRSRLSYLTNAGVPTTGQRWDLTVRRQAVKLQAAIQSVANYVFSDAYQESCPKGFRTAAAFCWALNCYTGRRPVNNTGLPVHLMVHRVRGQWQISICDLEAVLGLWTWSIKDGKKEEKEEAERRERDLLLSRKIFTAVDHKNPDAKRRAERELDLWILREKRVSVYDTLDEQTLSKLTTAKQESRMFSPLSLPVTSELPLPSNVGHNRNQENCSVGLLSLQTDNSVLVMAAQDIFSSFIDALASITGPLTGLNFVQSLRSDAFASEDISNSTPRPFLGLAHNHTDRLVDLFIQAGLGSRDDALLSVIPSFHSRSLLPSLMKESENLKSHARTLRAEERWNQAENLLIALYEEAKDYPPDGDTPIQSENLLRELGELYRTAMRSADRSHRSFGYRGVHDMSKEDAANDIDRHEEIKQNYVWVALELAKLHGGRGNLDDIPADLRDPLRNALKKDTCLSIANMVLQDVLKSQPAYPVGLLIAERFKDEIKKRESTETPLLIWAARKGCKELAEDLLEEGLDVNVLDGELRTPLSHACENGHANVAKLFLDANATLITEEYGFTPFLWAASSGHADVVQLFIGMNIDFDSKDQDGRSALWHSAKGGHDAVFKLLLQTGKVDVNSEDIKKQTVLLVAAKYGHDAIVKLILETGKSEVDAADDNGDTPLILAAERGHKEVVERLLDTNKCNIICEAIGRKSAAQNRHTEVVKLMLNRGKCGVNHRDEFDHTLLAWAADQGENQVVKMLLDTGKCDVDLKDWYGRTALFFAAYEGHKETVGLLLNAGCAIDPTDNWGWTPLLLAAKNRHKEVFELLYEMGQVTAPEMLKEIALAKEKEKLTGEEGTEERDLKVAKANARDTIVQWLESCQNLSVPSSQESQPSPEA